MSDIFISYKRDEQGVARTLANALETFGWDVWWDPDLQAGEDFEDTIEAALADAGCVIVLWSEGSVASSFVKDEARYARDHDKLVPVRIEDVTLPFRFRGIQTVELIDWDGDQELPAFLKLIRDITAIVGPPPSPAIPDVEDPGPDIAGERNAEREPDPAGPASIERSSPPGRGPFTRPVTWAVIVVLAAMLSAAAWFARDQFGRSSATDALADEWTSDGLPFCLQAIDGRYPIDRDAQSEIRLDDFGVFFGPGGKIDAFLDLIDSVDEPISLAADAKQQFDRAGVIQRAFFRSGSPVPSTSFELSPVRMDATIMRFTLDLAGQKISYAHGPRYARTLEWPGPADTSGVRMQVELRNDQSTQIEPGLWGWFRALDAATVSESNLPEQFELSFDIGGHSVVYEMTARSAYNPFLMSELGAFRCPRDVFE